jgi:hypothetical protein
MFSWERAVSSVGRALPRHGGGAGIESFPETYSLSESSAGSSPDSAAAKKWVRVTRILNEEGFRNRSGGEFKSPYVSKLAKENSIK